MLVAFLVRLWTHVRWTYTAIIARSFSGKKPFLLCRAWPAPGSNGRGKIRSGYGLFFVGVSHEFRHELCPGPIKVSFIRGELLPVSRGPANQLVQVLPLLAVVCDDLGEAMGQIVAKEGQV